MRPTSGLACALAALAAVVAVAGCGGGREGPREFVRRADRICGSFDASLPPVQRLMESSPDDYLRLVGEGIERLASRGQRAVEKLDALRPPSTYADDFDEYLDLSAERFRWTMRAGRAYAAGDAATAELMLPTTMRLRSRQHRAASAIPFRRCGRAKRS